MNKSCNALNLIELPTAEARRLKWEEGRVKYGDEFVGHPVLELDYELLDGMNYVEECRRRGYSMPCMQLVLRGLRWWVQRIWRRKRLWEHDTNTAAVRP